MPSRRCWLRTNGSRPTPTACALLGTFARGNPLGFHRRDGAGHALVAGQILKLDAINPQVAARLLGSFESWRRLAEPQRSHAREALAAMDGKLASPDSRDLLQRLLED